MYNVQIRYLFIFDTIIYVTCSHEWYIMGTINIIKIVIVLLKFEGFYFLHRRLNYQHSFWRLAVVILRTRADGGDGEALPIIILHH